MDNILFICGRNKWRSPTAENIYRNNPKINVRSAGVTTGSKHQVSQKDLEWADLILVMEQKYKKRIQDKFRHISLPPIISLDIPDNYNYMNKELISLIKEATDQYIK